MFTLTGLQWLKHTLLQQVPNVSVEDVDKASGVLSRGGLYTIIVVLAAALLGMFILKEWQLKTERDNAAKERKEHATELKTERDKFQEKLLAVVETQTRVVTQQVDLTEKMERGLQQVSTLIAESRAAARNKE